MRVEWAVACRFVEVHDGLATMVGAGIDNITIPQIPAEVGFMVAVRVAIAPGDTGQPQQVALRMLDPSLAEVGTLTAGFQMDGAPHAQPGWEGHITIPMVVGWQVAQAGAYTLHFTAGDSSYDLPVVVVAPT